MAWSSGSSCPVWAPIVVEPFERDELGAWDLLRSLQRLIEEIGIPGPHEDQASDLPGPEVIGDRAFSQRSLPRSFEGYGSLASQRVRGGSGNGRSRSPPAPRRGPPYLPFSTRYDALHAHLDRWMPSCRRTVCQVSRWPLSTGPRPRRRDVEEAPGTFEASHRWSGKAHRGCFRTWSVAMEQRTSSQGALDRLVHLHLHERILRILCWSPEARNHGPVRRRYASASAP